MSESSDSVSDRLFRLCTNPARPKIPYPAISEATTLERQVVLRLQFRSRKHTNLHRWMNGTSPTFEEHFLRTYRFQYVCVCSWFLTLVLSVSKLKIKSTLDFFALKKNLCLYSTGCTFVPFDRSIIGAVHYVNLSWANLQSQIALIDFINFIFVDCKLCLH